MDWRLGLDIGTNSIGWAVLRKDNPENFSVLDIGVRLFSDGREPAKGGRIGDPKAVARRMARQMRRRIERIKRRQKATIRYLQKNNILPADEISLGKLAALDPYELRSKAVTHDVSPYELGRIMMNFASRRGFKSSRKSSDAEDDQGKTTGPMIENLREKLGDKTLGQFLHERRKSGNPVRFRPGVSEFYPTRSMYIEEFEKIREKNSVSFPHLDWDRLKHILFDQRPLKRPERGTCRYYTDEPRAYSALPTSQRFRILGDLFRLSWLLPDGSVVTLSREELSQLYGILQRQKSLSFNKVKSLLKLEDDVKFNLESENFPALRGDETSCDLRSKNYLNERWDELSCDEQDDIVENLIVSDDPMDLKANLEKYKLSEQEIDRLVRYIPKSGVGMLSRRFMAECIDVMLKNHVRYDEAASMMGFHHSKEEKPVIRELLPYYGEVLTHSVFGAGQAKDSDSPENIFGRIANPTVHVALRQLEKVVNALIERHGKPSEIVVEVARDLKISREAKDEISRQQAKNKKANDEAKESLISLGLKETHIPSLEIKKYKLWKELAKEGAVARCVYCGKPISGKQLLSGEAEIEHILPFSRTLDDSMSNLTVAHKDCNGKKGNRTPYEAFQNEKGDHRIDAIIQRAQAVFSHSKARKFLESAMEYYEKEGEEGAAFIARQLTDTAYISKISRTYLQSVCGNVWCIPGRLTAILRGEWGFNVILGNRGPWFKNRFDHRHHAIDAVTIGLTDRGLLNRLSKANAHGSGIHAPKCPIQQKQLQELIGKTLVSVRPEHGVDGRLFKETALGSIKVSRKRETTSLSEDEINNLESKSILDIYLEFKKQGKTHKKALEEISKERPVVSISTREYVTRADITSLNWKDLTKDHRIVDSSIEAKILDYIDNHWKGRDGSEPSEKELLRLLSEFSNESGIRKVRYIPKDQTPITIPSAPFKAYMPDDFLYVDIWMLPAKKEGGKNTYSGEFVSRPDAMRGKPGVRPHPAAKKLMTLYKNDVIRLQRDGMNWYARVAGFSTTQNKLDIQPLNSTNTIKGWFENTNPHVLSGEWKPSCDGQNHVSINALFQSTRVSLEHISIDGRTRRR